MAISNSDIGSAQYGTGSGISYRDIGSAQHTPAAPSGGGRVIIITKDIRTDDEKKVLQLALAGACMVGKCTRRDFHKKAMVAATIGI